jgi:hypothetical protein
VEKSTATLLGLAVLAVTALAAFAVYRWRQRSHVCQVGEWVKSYLSARYGALPEHLHVNCSDDPLWPVLVAFDGPRPGARHHLRFACSGPSAKYALVSEKQER